MARGITINTNLKIESDSIRVWFESQPRSFYGGNNLQRDGHGYDSSYVDALWTETEEFFNRLVCDCELQHTALAKKELNKLILLKLLVGV